MYAFYKCVLFLGIEDPLLALTQKMKKVITFEVLLFKHFQVVTTFHSNILQPDTK